MGDDEEQEFYYSDDDYAVDDDTPYSPNGKAGGVASPSRGAAGGRYVNRCSTLSPQYQSSHNAIGRLRLSDVRKWDPLMSAQCLCRVVNQWRRFRLDAVWLVGV